MQINVPSANGSLKLHDSGHRVKHTPLLSVLLRSLPFASRAFQAHAIQVFFTDLLNLNCLDFLLTLRT